VAHVFRTQTVKVVLAKPSKLVQNILGYSFLVDEKHVAHVFRIQTVKVVLAKPSASWSRISLAAASLSMKNTWHMYCVCSP
jgi:hypothetical protein